jgi:hypothetical protein
MGASIIDLHWDIEPKLARIRDIETHGVPKARSTRRTFDAIGGLLSPRIIVPNKSRFFVCAVFQDFQAIPKTAAKRFKSKLRMWPLGHQTV